MFSVLTGVHEGSEDYALLVMISCRYIPAIMPELFYRKLRGLLEKPRSRIIFPITEYHYNFLVTNAFFRDKN